MLFGSHLGDWDVEDNLMRSVLATPTYGLACAYGGAPHWFFHHMALGETIGYSTRLTQNNPTNGIYSNDFNQAVGQVHVALMGDPTLRLQPVSPPSHPIASIVPAGVQLNWSPSPEPVAGYHIYRAVTPAGPFERLSQTLITATGFLDGTNSSGIYMIRAVKLQSSASGTYFNPSQGVFTIAAAPSDSDGDGMTDSAEAFAGTDPHDAASVLTILSVECPSNTLILFWSSIPGKTYRLAQRSVSPGESWSDAGNDIPSQGAVTSTAIPAPASPRVYTVRVLP